MNTFLVDSHMHTPLCKHAVGKPEQYAEMALERGIKSINITCHSPSPGGWSPHVRMSLDDYDVYLDLVDRARRNFQGKVDIYVGLEVDFIPEPGWIGFIKDLLDRRPLSYVLGSVHPHLGDYRKLYWKGSVGDFNEIYFEHLALAAESKLFHSIAHPDLVKHCYPNEWGYNKNRKLICASLDRIAATGTSIELNTSGLRKPPYEMNPGVEFLREVRARHIPVVLGSDAHKPARVGAQFDQALGVLKGLDFDSISYFLDGQRFEVPIESALAELREPSESFMKKLGFSTLARTPYDLLRYR